MFQHLEKYNGSYTSNSFTERKPSLASLDSLWKGMDDPKKTAARVEAIVTIELPEADFESQAASKGEADEKRRIVILMSSFPSGSIDFLKHMSFDLFEQQLEALFETIDKVAVRDLEFTAEKNYLLRGNSKVP